MIHAPMINSRRGPKRRPKHARSSVLAPTKALAILGGFGVLAVAAIAGCAAAQKGAGHDAGAARPAVRAAAGAAAPRVDAGAFVRAAAGLAQAADSGTPAPAALAGPAGGGNDGGNAAAIDGSDAAPDAAPVSGLAESGIPSTALSAYENAAARETARNPECGITWPLLAGIGRVESNHGRFAGAELHADGVSTPRIIGIPLDGHGTALIRDTDGGRLDGDSVYDRAVGPMQFIPSTWANWGVDANGDGLKDPFNLFDASAAAADYLCAAGRDLRTSSGQVHAILSYNYSYDYVSMVMGLERVYAGQTGQSVPILPVGPPQQGRPRHKPPLPPVDPGRPGGVSHPTNPRVPVKHVPTTPAASPSSSSHGPTPTQTPTSTSPSPTGSTNTPPPTCPTPTDTAASSASSDPSGTSAAPDPCASSTSPGPDPSSSDSASP